MGLERVAQRRAHARTRGSRAVRVITVGGTNGKGSVVAHLAALLRRAAAPRTGMFTSPHLLRYNERIRDRRQPRSADAELIDGVRAHRGGARRRSR